MAIHYNLHRFGVDEFAVGHLINGDLPDDEDGRWNVIDAPRYRIEKLLAEHVLAQNTLRQCRDADRPFLLFLRSFAAENKAERAGQAISSLITPHSKRFQEWLAFRLMDRSVPIIKLFGGSDTLFLAPSFPGAPDTGVLSTHADNWLEVVSELVSAASAIVFLVSHLSEGVALELGQIRSRECQDRCLIVLMDPQKTFSRDVGGDVATLKRTFHDFPNVFELNPSRESSLPSATSEAFRSCLEESLQHARAAAALNQSIDAEFSYLEPDYFLSDDYADTERFLWKELRRLRAVFHNTYWAALKARNISYRELRFDTEWLPAHRAYGLAIATADFGAIQAALFPLELLYTVRGSLYAFNIQALRHQYKELADKCMPSGTRDTESQYTDQKDPLMLPASQDAALRVFEYAETAAQHKNLDIANYLYQVAVNIALECDDRHETNNKWMLSRMTHDWAQFQARTNLAKWAVINYRFSLSLGRELGESDPERFLPEAALCLNNLGTLHYRLGNLDACEAAFQEAVDIRRRRPLDSEKYHENLGHSLMNLGMVTAARGARETARDCYKESIRVTAERLPKEPSAIVDLAHRQILLAHCLATMPGAEQDTQDAVDTAKETLLKVAVVNPEAARQFEAALSQRPQST